MPVVITVSDVRTRYPEITASDGDILDYICIADTKDGCLDSNYDECIARQIKLTFIAMMCQSSSNDQRIKSQRAPSGASRSFEYGGKDSGMTLKSKLNALDSAGCMSSLVPVENKFAIAASGYRCRR